MENGSSVITGDFNMMAGDVNIGYMIIGERSGVGKVELNGGTIELSGMLYMNWDDEATPPGQDSIPSASMDISGGQILFTTDQVNWLSGYINEPNAWITFYGSHPPDERYYILDYGVTNPGKTTLAGISPASVNTHRAWHANPGNGATVDITNGNITLSWNSGNPVGAYKHDVYFGTTNPPPYRRENSDVNSYIASAGVERRPITGR